MHQLTLPAPPVRFIYRNYCFLWALGLASGMFAGKKLPAGPGVIFFELALIIFFFFFNLILIRFLSLETSVPSSEVQKNIKANINYHFKLNCRIDRIFLRSLIVVAIPSLIFFLLGVMIASWFYFNKNQPGIKNILEESTDSQIITEGRISSHPYIKWGHIYFDFNISNLTIKNNEKVEVSLNKINEKVKVKMKILDFSEVNFSRDQFLKIYGYIEYSDISAKDSEIIILSDNKNHSLIKYSNFVSKLYSIRKMFFQCLYNSYLEGLGKSNSALAAAIILGDKSKISADFIEKLKCSGTYHIFAISGMHLDFYLSLIYYFLKRIRFFPLIILLLLFFLFFYIFLVGLKASMIRAAVMFVFVIFSRHFKREYQARIFLCYSFIFMLVLNFPFFLDSGFWLSFACLFALVVIYPQLIKIIGFRAFNRLKSNYFFKVIIGTVSILVFVTPLQLFLFKESSLAAIISNPVVLPIFSLILFFLYTTSILLIIWPPAGLIGLKPCGFLFNNLAFLIDYFARPEFLLLKQREYDFKNFLIYFIIAVIIILLVFMANKLKTKED